MPSRYFSLIALLCLIPALHAQNRSEAPATFQVYGGYSYLSNSLNGVPGSHHPLNGFDASIAFNSWHRFRFKIDTSGYFGSNLGSPQSPYFLLGGAQYTVHIRKRFSSMDWVGPEAPAKPGRQTAQSARPPRLRASLAAAWIPPSRAASPSASAQAINTPFSHSHARCI